MHILIVDGWTKEGNQQHSQAGCETQARTFEALIRKFVPTVTTTTVETHAPGAQDALDLTSFHAAVWTGGGGNIYKKNSFNRDQLKLCERVLAAVPYFWGSCWGLQVVVTVLGGQVAAARTPEIGIASDILTNPGKPAQQLYASKPASFDAPTHHGDEVVRLPAGFRVLAENKVTLQAVSGESGKIHCTQYHPELPYGYIRKLLVHWEPNYQNLFSRQAFQALLGELADKEQSGHDERTIEFKCWLEMISGSPTSGLLD